METGATHLYIIIPDPATYQFGSDLEILVYLTQRPTFHQQLLRSAHNIRVNPRDVVYVGHDNLSIPFTLTHDVNDEAFLVEIDERLDAEAGLLLRIAAANPTTYRCVLEFLDLVNNMLL